MRADAVTGYLSASIYHTRRHIYFDNLCCVYLAMDLLQNRLYKCGTLRSNRKGLDKRVDSKVVQALQVGNLTVSLWQDNRPVVVIATNSATITVYFRNLFYFLL